MLHHSIGLYVIALIYYSCIYAICIFIFPIFPYPIFLYRFLAVFLSVLPTLLVSNFFFFDINFAILSKSGSNKKKHYSFCVKKSQDNSNNLTTIAINTKKSNIEKKQRDIEQFNSAVPITFA